MKKKLIISFSGGRTSAYMLWWLLNEWKDRDNWEIIIVFANTGKEREETLLFIHQCEKHFGVKVIWVEYLENSKSAWAAAKHKVVDFETASRKGEPFEAMMTKYGMVNMKFPHCTRELKQNTIKSYARSIGWKKYFTAIGIRKDEPSRLDWVKAKKNRLMYPLASHKPTTKSDINLFWSKQPFDLTIKSYEGNCDFCWKKSFRKLMTIADENPKLLDWWKEMELKYENYIPPHREINENIKLPFRFFRRNMTVEDIVEDSKFPFARAKNEAHDIDKYKQTEMWDFELDSNDGCTESCEVY